MKFLDNLRENAEKKWDDFKEWKENHPRTVKILTYGGAIVGIACVGAKIKERSMKGQINSLQRDVIEATDRADDWKQCCEELARYATHGDGMIQALQDENKTLMSTISEMSHRLGKRDQQIESSMR